MTNQTPLKQTRLGVAQQLPEKPLAPRRLARRTHRFWHGRKGCWRRGDAWPKRSKPTPAEKESEPELGTRPDLLAILTLGLKPHFLDPTRNWAQAGEVVLITDGARLLCLIYNYLCRKKIIMLNHWSTINMISPYGSVHFIIYFIYFQFLIFYVIHLYKLCFYCSRCFDANLVDIPVEVETPDRHYYHVRIWLAFFAFISFLFIFI